MHHLHLQRRKTLCNQSNLHAAKALPQISCAKQRRHQHAHALHKSLPHNRNRLLKSVKSPVHPKSPVKPTWMQSAAKV
jgi:hypothetical protein